MRRLLLAVGLLLVAAPAAHAGGWATVWLSSTPAGTAPGAPWNVDITVLQHGRTPLTDVKPAVTIASGDATKTFAAKPTGKPGVYRASVVFPTAGKWSYEVDDGFIASRRTRIPAVADRRAPPRGRATTRRRRRSEPVPVAVPGIALLLAAVALVARGRDGITTSRRRRESHQPRRRWPRLRGGGDDDRRLRRRRPRRSAAAAARARRGDGRPRRRRSSPSRAAARCHTFAPANARGGIGPDLALSLNGKSRDYVLESIVAPDAVVAHGWTPA